MAAVAVHIVTYNSAATIARCIDGLRAQDGDVETHIIDNASADATVECIERAGLPVTVNAANTGYAAAHNQALAATRSRYVLTLNSDVLLLPGYITAMTRALDEAPAHGSAAGCLLRVDTLDDPPHAIDSAGLYMRRNRRQGLVLENAPLAQMPSQPRAIFGPDGAAAFYRRAMLDDIAVDGRVFDEDFFMHKEDVDVCWRAQLAGWTSVFVPDAKGLHIRGFRPNQRKRVAPALRAAAVRNRYLMMLKNEIPRLFWRDLLRIAAYDAAIFGYVLLREPGSLRGFVSAWRLRRKMLAQRRLIQSRRRAPVEEIARLFT